MVPQDGVGPVPVEAVFLIEGLPLATQRCGHQLLPFSSPPLLLLPHCPQLHLHGEPLGPSFLSRVSTFVPVPACPPTPSFPGDPSPRAKMGSHPCFIKLPHSQGRAADRTCVPPPDTVLIGTPGTFCWSSPACVADSPTKLSPPPHGLGLRGLCHPRSGHPAGTRILE